MKKFAWIMGIICLLGLVMQSCVHTPAQSSPPVVSENKESEKVEQTPSAEPLESASSPAPTDSSPEGEAVANIHINYEVDIMLYIDNPDWEYSYDAKSGQIFVFDPADATYTNVISISSYDIKTTADARMKDVWSQMEQSLEKLAPKITEEKDIVVGKEGYKGVRYSLTLTYEGAQSDVTYLLWATEKKVYLCSVTAVEKDALLVESILQGILDGFACFDK